jgi:hypothetical protein
MRFYARANSGRTEALAGEARAKIAQNLAQVFCPSGSLGERGEAASESDRAVTDFPVLRESLSSAVRIFSRLLRHSSPPASVVTMKASDRRCKKQGEQT